MSAGTYFLSTTSLVPSRSLLICCPREVWERAGEYLSVTSSDVTAHVYLLVEHQVSKSTIHFDSLSFSKQVEKHYREGTKEIIFPDQTIKYLYPNGAEECVFSDGIIQKVNVEGERTIEFPNGQRETHTKCWKFCLWNPENSSRSPNPSNDWNPESKYQRLEYSTWNLRRGSQNTRMS
ncbi:unnamed protein product [Porites evermanni]|uniref:Centromere protein J C-terminal domain-containing protein n=1 Tax=Porites evermanni TaxID=104178 RepID=A0ABN8QA33_9CNID|nr:unnamed protein product [Porites evermanni]